MTTLRSTIADLEKIDGDLTIYIASDTEWTADSPAITALEPEYGTLPPEASGRNMEYFLEVFIAKEVLREWKLCQRVETLPLEKSLEILLYYAKYDAYLPE